MKLDAELTGEIQRRAAATIAARADQLHWAAIRAWALEESGPAPTRARALADAEAELHTLCSALGELAALRPADVFPPLPPDPPWDEWS